MTVYILLGIFVVTNFNDVTIDVSLKAFSSIEQCIQAKENTEIPEDIDSYKLTCYMRKMKEGVENE